MSIPTRAGRRRPPRGFTLVELLVVIGIIAVLMSILLPSMGRARYAARVVTCAARMQQFAQAIHMYAGDHQGRLPSFAAPANGGVNLWDQSLGLYDALRDAYKFPHEMFFCPMTRDDLSDEKRGFWQQEKAGGYYRLGYCFWIPYKTAYGTLPPNPGDGQGYTFVAGGDGQPVAGPDRIGDAVGGVNPIITDVVFTFGGAGTPTMTTNLSRQKFGLYEYSQHVRDGKLDSINAGYLDGHVERVPGGDVHPRFLSKNNYWDWR